MHTDHLRTTAADYIRRIAPRPPSRANRRVPSDEELRTFAAVKEALGTLAEGGSFELRRAVAVAAAAADRHGAELGSVWKHVRRWRANASNSAEQLELPLYDHTL